MGQPRWHAYFRRVIALPDGRLKYSTATVNLGTSDLREARALEAELMRKNRETRLHQRYLAHLARLDHDATAMGRASVDLRPIRDHKRKRLKLSCVCVVGRCHTGDIRAAWSSGWNDGNAFHDPQKFAAVRIG